MSEVIDLSWPITHQFPVFPGDPATAVIQHHTYDVWGYNEAQLVIGTHTGTHIDVPLHKLKEGAAVDEIAIERFFGRALVADFTYLKAGDEIKLADLEEFTEDLKDCNTILLRTDWSKEFGKQSFFNDFPGITEEAAEWIVAQNLDMVGFESPSVNAENHVKIHEILLGNNVIIVEAICDLAAIQSKHVQFFAVPLKLKGLDGSPVRAYAIEE